MIDPTELTGQTPGRAVRLVIHYEGDQMTVLSRQDVVMATAPSDPISGFEGQSGFWVEVHDDQGQILYRRVLHPPASTDVEAFDPDTGPSRHTIPSRAGEFTVLVPALPTAQTVSVVASPAAVERRFEAAIRAAQFPLRGQG